MQAGRQEEQERQVGGGERRTEGNKEKVRVGLGAHSNAAGCDVSLMTSTE